MPYETGNLKVVAYRDGEIVAEDEVRTAGEPAAIVLEADRNEIKADGEDLSFVTVRLVDASGNFCPLADNRIDFSVSGAGVLEAVGNGDQTSVEQFQDDHIKTFNGMCLAIIRGGEASGNIVLAASAEGLNGATLTLRTRE